MVHSFQSQIEAKICNLVCCFTCFSLSTSCVSLLVKHIHPTACLHIYKLISFITSSFIYLRPRGLWCGLMEVFKSVGGKTYKLPVGYRFDPTDEILAGYYLRKRIMAQSLPNDLIQDYDVHQTEPWELPGGGKHMNWQRFFFYDVRSRVLGNPDKRDDGKGQWEMVEKDEEVGLSDEQVIGKKSVLVFWKAKGSSLAKTKWVMHEFRLALKSNPSKMSALAVCRIFERKNSKRAKKARVCEGESSNRSNIEGGMDVIDFTVECGGTETGPPPSPGTP